jgi:hypothetical protein
LNLATEEIQELISRMGKECDSIKRELIKMSWYMRGGLDYADSFMLSHKERELISELIKDNLEVTKKSKLSFF